MWWTYVLVGFGCAFLGFILAGIIVSKQRDDYAKEHEEFVKWINREYEKLESEKNRKGKIDNESDNNETEG